MAHFSSVELTQAILQTPYALSKQPYQYCFFKISIEQYPALSAIRLTLDITSGQTELSLNGFLGNPVIQAKGMGAVVTFDINQCVAGENILAYKGQVNIRDIEFVPGKGQPMDYKKFAPPDDPVLQAAQFLFNAQIKAPAQSPFLGACWTIFDYNSQCHRLNPWVWGNAVVVNCMVQLVKSGLYPDLNDTFSQFAIAVGDEFLRTRITDKASEIYGALVSRWKYSGHPEHSHDCYFGPNDTSFSVKWALLPLYALTGDEKYLAASKTALAWVQNSIRLPDRDYVPLHYDFSEQKWGDYSIIDTGFAPEGLTDYDELMGTKIYQSDIRFFMDRFIKQYRFENGFYGQNYEPEKGVDKIIFTRGLAWVLEGLLAAYRGTQEQSYLREAVSLAGITAQEQNADGSYNYILGYNGVPNSVDKNGTGICEKATAILAYLMYDLYTLDSSQTGLLDSADRAIQWCESNMSKDAGFGYGGIMGACIKSGITTLPYITVATQYANAFYILAKLKRRNIKKK